MHSPAWAKYPHGIRETLPAYPARKWDKYTITENTGMSRCHLILSHYTCPEFPVHGVPGS